MLLLAEDPRTLFVGQAVKYPGQAAFKSFEGVPMERRIELPVAEEFQMGLCTGLSLGGYLPVSFYTRWDFLILAMNQLVNHLDKLPLMGWRPKVIIRTSVGRVAPLDPGPQHCQDHGEAVASMLDTVEVVELLYAETVVPAYERALRSPRSTILVEHMRLY
jgi:pyruvate/2-oxoglutarate/acetoin dehydrogenase E1 component